MELAKTIYESNPAYMAHVKIPVSEDESINDTDSTKESYGNNYECYNHKPTKRNNP